MKYYIATSIERALLHNIVRDDLQKLGHEISYDWTMHGSVKHTSKARLKEVANYECLGILASDFVLVLLPGGKGTHVELGLSIASKKRVFVHCEDPMMFETGPQTCAFYHHPNVLKFSCPIAEVAKNLHVFLEDTALTPLSINDIDRMPI